ncbi:zinc finger protein AEBP2-like isoform X1 [Osmerus eperlanus]|uniref:zinc finger protein AEBP2-like isoform X1 n=1 Tax=Osmerus eperlanus TaxID=29151 RepID=UPI002E146B9B
MAAATTDGTDQDSPYTSDHNGTGDTGEDGEKTRGLPDSKQEPGDNENGLEMDVNDGHGGGEEHEKPSPDSYASKETVLRNGELEMGCELSVPGNSPEHERPSSSSDPVESWRGLKEEQREESVPSPPSSVPSPPSDLKTRDDCTEKSDHGIKRRASLEISSSDGEPLSRMDSEDSISSPLVDQESTLSSGRSTPAMMHGGAGISGGSKGYACLWDGCLQGFLSSPDLAEHLRAAHGHTQTGGVFVCLWKGCKVFNTPSTSQSWLQRHMLSHSGDKPFKCVVGGCSATFASQGGLARHVPTHFSAQSSKLANQSRGKEESPSKAGLNKRRKLKNKRRRSLLCSLAPARPHDFFDAMTMDAIRHRAICLNLATHIESQGHGHSVVFHSTVIARRKEDSGKVKVLLHWTPEDILADVWVSESERPQQKTKVVHLSQLPPDTAVQLAPSIYRMFF